MQIFIEPVAPESELSTVLELIRAGRIARRRVFRETGKVTVTTAETAGPVSCDDIALESFHGPAYRLLIIGAGQLSEYVARMSTPLGYRVTVCDPREEYLAGWQTPETELVKEMPDDLIVRVGLDRNSAVIALTHDPKIDDLALLEALKSPAFYVGAIGSRANCRKRRERLRLFDLTDEQIAALRAPIGMHIGAKTPPEIAISIVAELTSYRNRVEVVQTHALRPERAATV